jgi:proline iminopeptidase
MYVRDIGTGPPIIVVHGGPDFDHQYLLPEMDTLADIFHLVYYDQRGRGQSFAGQRLDDVTITSEVNDLDSVRERFGFDQVAVLGHSWGGLLAATYAIRRPDRVSHLILMNCAPLSHEAALAFRRHLKRIRSREQLERMAALRSSAGYERGDIDTDLDYYRIHFASAVSDPALLDRLLPRLRSAFTPESVLAARAIEVQLYADTWDDERYDLLPRLHALRARSLVIHGDRDLIPIEIAREIARAIPGSQLVTLEDCGHFAYLEQPHEVREHLAALLLSGARGEES